MWMRLALVAGAATAALALSPSVSVGVHTSWDSPEFAIQVLETVAHESSDAFYRIFPSVIDEFDASRSDEQTYAWILGLLDRENLLKDLRKHLALSLSIRETAAKSEAKFAVYDDFPSPSHVSCDPDARQSWISSGPIHMCSFEKVPVPLEKPLSFDYVYGNDPQTSPAVVLWADLHSPNLRALWDSLVASNVNVLVRWTSNQRVSGKKLPLAAYGSALNIKKSDYLTIDDRQQQTSSPMAKESTSVEIEQVKKSDIEVLSLKTAQSIVNSDDPLEAFVNITGDFPALASKIAQSPEIPKEALQQLHHYKSALGGALDSLVKPSLIINGQAILDTSLLPIFRSMRTERDITARLRNFFESLSVKVPSVVNVLTRDSLSKKGLLINGVPQARPLKGQTTDLDDRFDASDRTEQEDHVPVILYLNDLTELSDQWPSSVQSLLSPAAFQEQLVPIAKNLQNAIFILDLQNPENLRIVSQFFDLLLSRNVPIRVGLVPRDIISESPASRALGLVTYEVLSKASPTDLFIIYRGLLRSGSLAVKDIRKEYTRLYNRNPKLRAFDDLADDPYIEAVRAYLERLNVKDQDAFFFNGLFFPFASLAEDFRFTLQRQIFAGNSQLQIAAYKGEVSDDKDDYDLENYFYDLPLTFQDRSFAAFNKEPIRVDMSLFANDIDSDISFGSVLSSRFALFLVQSQQTYDLIQEKALPLLKDMDYSIQVSLVDCSDPRFAASCKTCLLTPESDFIAVNGRLITLSPDEKARLSARDIVSLAYVENAKVTRHFYEALDGTTIRSSMDSAAFFKLMTVGSSLTALASARVGNRIDPVSLGLRVPPPQTHKRDYWSFTKGNSDAEFQIYATLDPASETAQQFAPLLKTLSQLDDSVFISVRFLPVISNNDIPIKRFYRYAGASAPTFDVNGPEVAPGIDFFNVPESTLLTFFADLPYGWVGFPQNAVHDLDNIRLADLDVKEIHADIELTRLIVEGFAQDSFTPRGLQLELVNTKTQETIADTIVMANLNYFQLRSPPGITHLRVREGRSADVFSLSDADREVIVDTMEGVVLRPVFNRHHGAETVDLLSETAEQSPSKDSWLQKGLSYLRPQVPSAALADKADINIFTMASGLLYERMAFIMMLSVMKNTNSTVKFWFVEDFLSPSFKAFIPHFAAEYGFSYELITYKWPSWLRAQSEKQRTIWGYKILFLDVLFPLGLDRVIFVDSDQIVRTDLKQLIDMDLQGAPYAYAPMGDDRKEMEGFRFWKQGYWASRLGGRPYHISALYVVDLERFRQMAAGDRLRAVYQQLSADPNSLANLDQDLPNDMQSAIPIHTLDPSWLWCETWCSDESLATAKTVDLCNNPLTHEPKLQRARRMLSEWSVYDEEVSSVARKYYLGLDQVSAFARSANDLEQAKQQSLEQAKQQTINHDEL